MAMTIALCTHKGGTGKTTTSINLASGLSRAGKKTLLIDFDPQAHSSLGLGIEINYQDLNIADVISNQRLPLKEIIRSTNIPNLDIAPSNLRLAAVAETLYATFKKEERLERSLNPIKNNYQWIIIDCPPALSVLTANALVASDLIIIPCQMAAQSLYGLGDLLDLIRLLKGETFENWQILLTMIDQRKTITQEIFQELIKPYQDKLLNTKIFINESLNQSQIARQDIFTFDSKSKGAQNYQDLTKELLQIYNF